MFISKVYRAKSGAVVKSRLIVILGLLGFASFGCTWERKAPSGPVYGVQLGPQNKFKITGMKLTADDPLHDALVQAYEICGGKVEGDMAEIEFHTSAILPTWSEEAQAWRYSDVRCGDSSEDDGERRDSPEHSISMRIRPPSPN